MSHAERKSKLEFKLWTKRVVYILIVAVLPPLVVWNLHPDDLWAIPLWSINPVVALLVPCGDKTFGSGKRYYWLRQSILSLSLITILASTFA